MKWADVREGMSVWIKDKGLFPYVVLSATPQVRAERFIVNNVISDYRGVLIGLPGRRAESGFVVNVGRLLTESEVRAKIARDKAWKEANAPAAQARAHEIDLATADAVAWGLIRPAAVAVHVESTSKDHEPYARVCDLLRLLNLTVTTPPEDEDTTPPRFVRGESVRHRVNLDIPLMVLEASSIGSVGDVHTTSLPVARSGVRVRRMDDMTELVVHRNFLVTASRARVLREDQCAIDRALEAQSVDVMARVHAVAEANNATNPRALPWSRLPAVMQSGSHDPHLPVTVAVARVRTMLTR
jgi:hypothetical protein